MLPFHHQALIRGMIEMVLGPSYPLDRRVFHYSGLKGQTKVGRNGLHFYSKRVTLVLASSDKKLIQELCDAIFRYPSLFLGNLMLEPEMVEKEVVEPPQGITRYLCISPLVLHNTVDPYKSKEFIHPSSNKFSDFLYESTMERMEKVGYTPEQTASFYKFQIVPDQQYLERLSQRHKKFARIYVVEQGKHLQEVRGYTFPFSLYASQEVHEFIFHNGFGEFTQHGFGMIDYHDPKFITREPYSLSSASGREASQN